MIPIAFWNIHIVRYIQGTPTPFSYTSLQHATKMQFYSQLTVCVERILLQVSTAPCGYAVHCEHRHHWPKNRRGSIHKSDGGKEINIKLNPMKNLALNAIKK